MRRRATAGAFVFLKLNTVIHGTLPGAAVEFQTANVDRSDGTNDFGKSFNLLAVDVSTATFENR